MEADTNLRTVGCRLEKLIPDAQTVSDIRMAVQRVHEATIQATSLLNLHIRRCIHDGVILHGIFNGNWITKAFQEVTVGDKASSVELSKARRLLMPDIRRVNRTGLTQLMQANANMLETVGHNNYWMHIV